jgi:hypothetical protein
MRRLLVGRLFIVSVSIDEGDCVHICDGAGVDAGIGGVVLCYMCRVTRLLVRRGTSVEMLGRASVFVGRSVLLKSLRNIRLT